MHNFYFMVESYTGNFEVFASSAEYIMGQDEDLWQLEDVLINTKPGAPSRELKSLYIRDKDIICRGEE